MGMQSLPNAHGFFEEEVDDSAWALAIDYDDEAEDEEEVRSSSYGSLMSLSVGKPKKKAVLEADPEEIAQALRDFEISAARHFEQADERPAVQPGFLGLGPMNDAEMFDDPASEEGDDYFDEELFDDRAEVWAGNAGDLDKLIGLSGRDQGDDADGLADHASERPRIMPDLPLIADLPDDEADWAGEGEPAQFEPSAEAAVGEEEQSSWMPDAEAARYDPALPVDDGQIMAEPAEYAEPAGFSGEPAEEFGQGIAAPVDPVVLAEPVEPIAPFDLAPPAAGAEPREEWPSIAAIDADDPFALSGEGQHDWPDEIIWPDNSTETANGSAEPVAERSGFAAHTGRPTQTSSVRARLIRGREPERTVWQHIFTALWRLCRSIARRYF